MIQRGGKALFCMSWLGLLLLAGCAKDAGPAVVADAPEVGGYARDLAAPPAQTTEPDIASNIAAGSSTDDRDIVRQMREEQEQAAAAAKKPAAAPQGEQPPAQPAEAAAPKKVDKVKPDTTEDAKYQDIANPVLAMQTAKGTVYMEMWPKLAPKHVANMLKLAEQKFYDGIVIHRVEPGFVVQAGDPLTKELPLTDPRIGTGGPGWNVPAEFSKEPHVRGILSMARSQDPNSGGSQFFIVLDNANFLDNQYSVFGKVLGDGMAVVDQLRRGDQIQLMRIVHRGKTAKQ